MHLCHGQEIADLDGAWILTRHGNLIDCLDPVNSNIEIEDIAHGLSHICRFSGHTREFYSVAQHSLYVSMILPDELAMAGLLHDAAEAFIGDMPTPIKRRLPVYKEIELAIERVIFARYGLPHPLPIEVKRADLAVLATEVRDLMPRTKHRWLCIGEIQPLDLIIRPMTPARARSAFLQRFRELRAGLRADSSWGCFSGLEQATGS